MWTPKRILLLLSSSILFFAVYLGYAFWLGGIDGLPPLPHGFEPPGNGPIEPIADILRPTPEADRKLELAFGPSWKELLLCKIKLEMRNKNLVLATNDIDTQRADGRVLLAPFNVAIFKEDPGRTPEINTIRSDAALLTFDRPITNLADVGRHKLVACELQGRKGREDGGISVRNNRRTPQANDDISLMTPGPLYYYEDKHLICTPAEVRLVDEQTKPEQSTITAVGMELRLTTEPEPKPGQPAAPTRAKKSQSISGVESIHLLKTVDMYLWVESSGFLGGNTDKPQPGESSAQIPKLHIATQGPFHYYVSADEDKTPDRAVFELPPNPGRLAEKVTVTRIAGPKNQEKRDQLHSDRLELTFRRKSEGAAPREGSSVNLAIQDAHATGQLVQLQSDTDMLDAMGNDFFYDARTKQSTLKGAPVVAMKDGHEITAGEIQIDTGQRDVRQAKARGPGRINLLDRAKGKRNLHARWSEALDFVKEGTYDCLTLRGDAVFEDTDNEQLLQADLLKVWLQPAERDAPPGSETHKLRPHHLKATGHVRAVSAELLVRDKTEDLTIWFKDVAARAPAPAKAPNDGVAAPYAPTAGVSAPSPSTAPSQPPTTGPGGLAPRGFVPNAPGNKSKKPIELSARSVETHVLRTGERNELERVSCKGAVHVHQEPAEPGDKGVDIRGDHLTLDHFLEGSILVVTGSLAQLAQVQLNKLTIAGPEVKIDQKSNTAWVYGIGAMQMLTEKSFEGEKLDKPTELTVHWQREMYFDGRFAFFQGHVQAEQNSSTLLCENLQAYLDQKVSFKEGEKRGQSATVREMVCDRNVRIDDEVRDGSQLLRRTRLVSPEVSLNKDDSVVDAKGPGVLHLLQLGNKDEAAPGQAPQKPTQKTEQELKLTRVTFRAGMHANNKKRIATFWGDVDVVHLPTEDIDQPIDIDKRLPGMMYLHCEKLKVLSVRHADGRTTQEMEAERKVTVEAQEEFSGRGDVLKYDESKELVILEGGETGLATLYRVQGKGGKPDMVKGKKLFYFRKTNEIKGDEVTGVNLRQ